MTIKIDMLRCFQTVAHRGRLGQAAEALGRTAPAISVSLKNLEEHVGAPLFEKPGKSRLTKLGQSVLQETERALINYDRSVQAIASLANAHAGYVRLAVTPTVATAVLPDVIRRFHREFPHIRIDIKDMDSDAVQRELENDRVDIGIATIGLHTRLERRLLLSDEFGIACPVGHPLTKKKGQLEWADLDVDNLISNGLCRLIDDPEFQFILDNVSLRVTNQASLLALVKAGVGVTVLPRLAISSDIEGIAFLPLPSRTARRNIYVVTLPRAQLLPAARRFLEFLEA